VNGLDASGMQSVTRYAPARIAALGILKAIFGTLVLGMGVLAYWAAANGDMAPKQPGDMPSWWMMLVGVGLAVLGFAILSGGLGRAISAFAGDCFFRAGTEGIAIRLPKQGWFGRFTMTEHRHKWDEIEQTVHFTHRINFVPVSRELRIRLYGGREIAIARFYFADSVKTIQGRLEEIRARAGK